MENTKFYVIVSDVHEVNMFGKWNGIANTKHQARVKLNV